MNLPQRLWSVSPATFSGGERQRVNLARGFAARPRLLLLDEPTASLDPATAECVIRLIEGLKAEGTAMLAIFHHPETTRRLADQVVELAPPPAVEDLHKESA
jgi:alpha-D-ribose 1-methylphosphonate 5-triphosphate synthase subunit PhnL